MPLNIFHRIKGLFIYKNRFYYFVREITGFAPNNIEYFELAFVHKSASVYHGKGFSVNNERLEFLGDSILDAIIADYLFEIFPNENEGFLTNLRSRLVNRQSLNELAAKIGLDKHIKAQTDKCGLAPSVLGNALEAFIGAVFLDMGYVKTRKFIIYKLIEPNIDLKKLGETDTNFKGRVIDWAQKQKKEIEFVCTEEISTTKSGKVFVVKLIIDGNEIGKGQGDSKKEAEQHAAEFALQRVKKK